MVRKDRKNFKAKSLGQSDYFDDCPICQAQKKADLEGRGLTLEELRQAFSQAKEKGARVGGLPVE